MSLERRLKKIEDSVGKKNKDFLPLIVIYKDEADKEKQLREYTVKCGEDFSGQRRIIFLPKPKDHKENLLPKLTKNDNSEQKGAGNDRQT